MTAPCNDCTLLSLHNAITTHPTRPPPYPGVNRQTLASLSFSATTAPTCWPATFHPLPPPTTTAPRSPFYPGVNQKMHPLLIPQPALGTPPLPLPGSPCTLTLTSPSLPPSIPLSYPRVDCHTRTPARCHRPFLLHPEHRTPTARCSECNLLSQHSAIIPISSSSPRTHCTTARSPPGTTCRTCHHPSPQPPAFTHPPQQRQARYTHTPATLHSFLLPRGRPKSRTHHPLTCGCPPTRLHQPPLALAV